jgi:hypothetical protein
MNEADIAHQHKAAYAELLARYGGRDAIPEDELTLWAERTRALYVLDLHPDANPVTVLRTFGVGDRVIAELTDGVGLDAQRKLKRSDRYAAIEAWAKANPGKDTTVYEVADVGGFSYSTANNFIKDRVDLFRRVKKGEYQLRDVVAERAAAKSA